MRKITFIFVYDTVVNDSLAWSVDLWFLISKNVGIRQGCQVGPLLKKSVAIMLIKYIFYS